MSNRSDERSRALGGILCLGTVGGGAFFLYGLAVESYWALALPLAVLVLFVLGLVFWIGWTILTIRVEPEGETITPSGGGPGSATTPDPGTSTSTEGSADPGS